MNAACLDDAIVGPTCVAGDLYNVAKKAVEDSIEYQEFVLKLNETMTQAAQNGNFSIEINMPTKFWRVMCDNYMASNFYVGQAEAPNDGIVKACLAWMHKGK